MPNHSEHATHLSTLSDLLDHSASDMDESVERGEGVNCTKDCVGSEEQEASGSTLQEAPLELYEQMVRTLYDYYRSEEHTSELQSPDHLLCPLLLEQKNTPHHY